MVERLFPRALVACIGEGRTPKPDELMALTDKVWREAFSQGGDQSAHACARRVARTALVGTKLAA